MIIDAFLDKMIGERFIFFIFEKERRKMSRYRKSRLLEPEAYDAMTRFKLEVAQEMGRTQYCKEFNDHYKGDLTARENGSGGGPIGGEMVRRMIEKYQNELKF